jgi:hypothetical protein
MGYTYRLADLWQGFMKHAVQMGPGAVIFIPSFIKIRSGIQKADGEDIQTHSKAVS